MDVPLRRRAGIHAPQAEGGPALGPEGGGGGAPFRLACGGGRLHGRRGGGTELPLRRRVPGKDRQPRQRQLRLRSLGDAVLPRSGHPSGLRAGGVLPGAQAERYLQRFAGTLLSSGIRLPTGRPAGPGAAGARQGRAHPGLWPGDTVCRGPGGPGEHWERCRISE